jgi:hypothetical protein
MKEDEEKEVIRYAGRGSSGIVMAVQSASCIAAMVRLWGREEAPIRRSVTAWHAQRRWGGEERCGLVKMVVSYNIARVVATPRHWLWRLFGSQKVVFVWLSLVLIYWKSAYITSSGSMCDNSDNMMFQAQCPCPFAFAYELVKKSYWRSSMTRPYMSCPFSLHVGYW